MSRRQAAQADHLQIEQVDALLAAAGAEGLREIFAAFGRSTTGLLLDLAAQLDRADLEGAAAGAHALKGSAANVGAGQLSLTAARLENACKNGRPETLKELLDALNEDYATARALIEDYLSTA